MPWETLLFHVASLLRQTANVLLAELTPFFAVVRAAKGYAHNASHGHGTEALNSNP
jgi:hypothetical protein